MLPAHSGADLYPNGMPYNQTAFSAALMRFLGGNQARDAVLQRIEQLRGPALRTK
jgi:hypothetical protein